MVTVKYKKDTTKDKNNSTTTSAGLPKKAQKLQFMLLDVNVKFFLQTLFSLVYNCLMGAIFDQIGDVTMIDFGRLSRRPQTFVRLTGITVEIFLEMVVRIEP
ncbi:hypothetical protein [Candidatus Magnetobacterium casense]|uniref:hypothetical protein n=1 Tax=Candidatus Magnetobacterium casense TaxID=1455061 RepID=UPI0012DCD039|nr:hypothetical protein [Candidatus Magnetobacterium casensis]